MENFTDIEKYWLSQGIKFILDEIAKYPKKYPDHLKLIELLQEIDGKIGLNEEDWMWRRRHCIFGWETDYLK